MAALVSTGCGGSLLAAVVLDARFEQLDHRRYPLLPELWAAFRPVDPGEVPASVELGEAVEDPGRGGAGVQRCSDVLCQVLTLRPLRLDVDLDLVTRTERAAVQPAGPRKNPATPSCHSTTARTRMLSMRPPIGWRGLGPHSVSGSNGTGTNSRPRPPSVTVALNLRARVGSSASLTWSPLCLEVAHDLGPRAPW